jgi:tellurite resistance-related uncharacterized protein
MKEKTAKKRKTLFKQNRDITITEFQKWRRLLNHTEDFSLNIMLHLNNNSKFTWNL